MLRQKLPELQVAAGVDAMIVPGSGLVLPSSETTRVSCQVTMGSKQEKNKPEGEKGQRVAKGSKG